MIYNFEEDIIKGQFYETQLDKYFRASGEYTMLHLATDKQQRQGIDRVFVKEERGLFKQYFVEYKADWLAGETQNTFIETVSNNINGSEGWSIKSMADILIYYIIGSEMILVIEMSELRGKLPDFIDRYPSVRCTNKNYYSFGRLVPVVEIEKIAYKKLIIEKEVFHET